MQNAIRTFLIGSFIFVTGLYESVHAQNVTRGPYLQIGTSSRITVRWRTDEFSNSRVRYGTILANLSFNVEDLVSTTEHEVTLTGLSPDTKYYYSIGTTSQTLAGGDVSHFFISSPVAGTRKPTRIWILGDSGTKNNNARSVRDAYYNYTADRHTDLWLMLGDNAYRNGSDGEYQLAIFENMYEAMLRKSALWPTLGNHDDNTSSSPGPYPYYDMFTLPRNGEAGGMASGTEAYYSFDYGNIHFICLNSTTSDLRSTSSAMWIWLEEDLAANDKDWTIAYWHHPPYSKGSHDSDSERELIQMRERALPILEDSGVDLVLCGHSHSYERSFLLDGHYGKSNTLTAEMKIDDGDGQPDGVGAYMKETLGSGPHEGAVYVVAGSSGKTSGGTLDHPVMITSLNVLGSMILDIDGNRMDAKFIDDNGNIRDFFTMLKGLGEFEPATHLELISGNNQTAPVGTALSNPFVVEARDANNKPVAGVSVTFDVISGDGILSNSQPQVTDLNGQTSTTLLLGMTPGINTITATATGLSGSPQTFTAIGFTVSGTVTVSFQDGVDGYNGTRDSKLLSDSPSTNYGSATELEVDGSPDYAALLYWDLMGLPLETTIESVLITLDVTDITQENYEFYEVKRPWIESEATWEQYSMGQNWQIGGGDGLADRDTTVLGSITASSLGLKTISLNEAGIALVQSWVNDPSSNLGFILMDYTNATNGLDFFSRETGTVANRPKLTITYSSSGPQSPMADFTGLPLIGMAPLAVAFTNQSTGDITSSSWDFGDGDTDIIHNPWHAYTSAGSYTVSLTLTGIGGSDTESKIEYITVLADTTPPTQFSLLSPPNEVWFNTRLPLFKWSTSTDENPGLAGYNLFLNDSLNKQLPATVTNTLPMEPLDNGWYKWYVTAFDSVGVTRRSDSVRTFTIDYAAPVSWFTYPNDGDTLEISNITILCAASDSLSTPAAGIKFLEVSIDSAQTWVSAIPLDSTFTQWKFDWQDVVPGTYYLSSRAVDQLGNIELPKAAMEITLGDFTPPGFFTLLTPPDSAWTNSVYHTFTWTRAADAVYYQLYIDTLIAMERIPFDTTSVQLIDTLAEGSHTWFVQAFNDSGNARRSSSVHLLRVDRTPPLSWFLFPQNEDTLETGNLTILCAASDSLSSPAAGVKLLEVSFDSAQTWVSAIPLDSTYTQWKYEWQNIVPGTYNLHSRAVDRLGNIELPKPAHEITVGDFTPPGSFTLLTPPDSAWTNSVYHTFTWTRAADAVYYQLYIDTLIAMERIPFDTTSVQLIDTLAEGSHTWFIQAFDDSGNARRSSSVHLLRIDRTPPLSWFLFPQNEDTLETGNITILCAATDSLSSPAAGVKLLEVSFDSAQTWVSATPLDSTYTQWKFEWQNIVPGTYNLNSRAVDRLGNIELPKPAHEITVGDFTPPGSFTLLTPPDSAWTNSFYPTFTWIRAADAVYYQLYIDTLIAMERIPFDTTSVQLIDTLAEGSHTWFIQAFDDSGNARRSSSVHLLRIDRTPPISRITFPLDKTFFPDSTLTIQGIALDSSAAGIGIGLDFVEVSMDSGQTWTITTPIQSDYLNWQFILENPGNGRHDLLSRSADKLGNLETPSTHVSIVTDLYYHNNSLPKSFELLPAYPNPFSFSKDRKTAINILLEAPQSVDLVIQVFNIWGQTVAKIFAGKIFAGKTHLRWKGLNSRGEQVAAGVYFIHLKTPQKQFTRKILLLH